LIRYLKFELPEWDDRITDLPKRIQNNVFEALQQGMELTAGVAQTKYLSGPRPTKLAVVTGLLRSSVKAGAYLGGEEGAFATGTLTAGQSGMIKYATIHEFGGVIDHPGAETSGNQKKMRFFWKKTNTWVITRYVRPHKIPIPARPYLGPAMEEMATPDGVISRMIRKAINMAFYF